MKATLEFDLPEDEERFQMAIKGVDYSIILSNIKSFIRTQLKYGITMNDELLLETIRDLIPQEDNI